MKISVEKMKQVNTVFTFVFFILISLFIAGSLVYAAVDFLGNLSPSHDRGVDIIENIDTEAEESVYSTEFVSAVKDVYVFAKKGGAVSFGIDKAAVKAAGYSVYSDYSPADEILNFYFVPKTTQQTKALFDRDALIVSYEFAREENENTLYGFLPKNIYVAVLTDTDGDKKLTSKDNTALYVSEYDGSGLKKISDDIFSYELVADTGLLFCEYENGRCIYKCYNMTDDTVKTVFTAAGREPKKQLFRFHPLSR